MKRCNIIAAVCSISLTLFSNNIWAQDAALDATSLKYFDLEKDKPRPILSDAKEPIVLRNNAPTDGNYCAGPNVILKRNIFKYSTNIYFCTIESIDGEKTPYTCHGGMSEGHGCLGDTGLKVRCSSPVPIGRYRINSALTYVQSKFVVLSDISLEHYTSKSMFDDPPRYLPPYEQTIRRLQTNVALAPCTVATYKCEDNGFGTCVLDDFKRLPYPKKDFSIFEGETTIRMVRPPYQLKISRGAKETHGTEQTYTKELYVESSISTSSSIGIGTPNLQAEVSTEIEKTTGVVIGKSYSDIQSVTIDGNISRDWMIYVFDILQHGNIKYSASTLEHVDIPFSYIGMPHRSGPRQLLVSAVNAA